MRWMGALGLALLCGAGAAGAQETVAVFDFEAIGISEQEAEGATQLFRNDLAATGRFTVRPRAEVQSALAAQEITDAVCHATTCAADYGGIVGVEKSVIGSLTMLGGRITAEVSLVDVVQREVVFTDRFAASSIADLDAVLGRLATAVAEQKKIVSEVGRFNVTEEEARDARRKKSFFTIGVAFGGGFPLDNSYAGLDNLKSLLILSRYEANKFVVETTFGAQWGSAGGRDTLSSGMIVDKKQVAIVPFDVGLRYLFHHEKDVTPFVGGGIGLHLITSQEESGQTYLENDQAFAFHGCGGIVAFQSYDFRLSLEGRYTALFSDTFGGEKSVQSQIGFLLGLTYRVPERKHTSGCGPSGGGGCGGGPFW
jgi:hypothetical protein